MTLMVVFDYIWLVL